MRGKPRSGYPLTLAQPVSAPQALPSLAEELFSYFLTGTAAAKAGMQASAVTPRTAPRGAPNPALSPQESLASIYAVNN